MGKRYSKKSKNLSGAFLKTAEENLIFNAEILGFNLHGEMERMKSYEKRQYLAKQVLENPLQVLNHLSYEDFVLIYQLVYAEPGMCAVYAMNGAQPPSVTLGLIERYPNMNEGKVSYSMTDDLIEAVGPFVEKASDEIENKFRFFVESLVLGALNIYGCLTESQLKSLQRNTCSSKMMVQVCWNVFIHNRRPSNYAVMIPPTTMRNRYMPRPSS